ncbi:Na+/H+ antiporter NhaA [Brevibacterium linens]|uniref:Na(+)/H(+) antiporter NhaA n=1 Tax=Brevibacterium linens ATCC 9172 TaxID=1255617 RepID=A0A2H1HSX9_BRELN|nr:sodium/proton antiporter, NhaA family (TC 2.A.33.1.1) [Brevibacterium linens ATCC 9172]
MTTTSAPTSRSASPNTPGQQLFRALRRDTVGGALLLIAAAAALIWANSPASAAYFAIRDWEFGYEPWHLRLSIGQWAADGLLAVFFFLVGIELKAEFTRGDLRRLRTAVVPITAAAGGVLVPALICAALLLTRPELLRGWAIPTATDIAFAVAVLAIVGSHLPKALRIFLLTLAAVDDLLAITIIAVFYTETIAILPLATALGVVLVFGLVAHRFRRVFVDRAWAAWVVLLSLGLIAWALMHASGVHATIAGVLLGFMIPAVVGRGSTRTIGTDHGASSNLDPSAECANRAGIDLAEALEHRLRPLSAGFAVPVFAFFAAGVDIGGTHGLASAFSHPLTYGIMTGLIVGKPLGILVSTWLVTRFTGGLNPGLRWADITGIGLLAGIGFTVSLLVAELSFTAGSIEHDVAKVAVLSASLLSAALAALILTMRNARYRRLLQARKQSASGV